MPTRFELANAIRALSMDAVQKANSGHPGMPMGMADIAEVLWNDYLHHNPSDPHWFNRDRFVLSNGHGSMLLYSLLHLTGYDLPLEEIKNFRQFHSKTPGHPEVGHTPGVETTTGPLGQGLAMGVGMALAEKLLAAQYNRDGLPVIDHYTYVFAGDGCLMEGVSHEASSLAGTFGLGKLIVFYDDNSISIDGEVRGWFRDDTAARFEAYGWEVVRNVNGHDPNEVRKAIETARSQTAHPTLICCKTVIGFGAPNKQGTAKAHGAALGEDEIKLARDKLGWHHGPFEVPQEIYAGWDARARGKQQQTAWNELFAAYARQHPEAAAELKRRIAGELPQEWAGAIAEAIAKAAAGDKPVATRKSSEAVLNVIAPKLPDFVGGSADLTESNNTLWHGAKHITPGEVSGQYISWGVREFGMSAALNGMALHGGIIPFGGTFLVFSDYCRNAIRLSALMRRRVIYVLTHDSIGLGEDGPTHQPVEHLAMLRATPGLQVFRPADIIETAEAWELALASASAPSVLVLSRQALPMLRAEHGAENRTARGAYLLREPAGERELTLLATGSEAQIAHEAADCLSAAYGLAVAVVSMPSWELFEAQDDAYRAAVLGRAPRIGIEAAGRLGWDRWIGERGAFIGMPGFGASAPADDLYRHFGITVDAVIEQALRMVREKRA